MRSRPVALTFDDGPDSTWTPRVLDALDRAGTCATFFVIGAKLERHPELAREALARGHALQPHCFSNHTSHERMDRAEIEQDIDRTLTALAGVDAPKPTMWRPPFGAVKRGDSFEIAAARSLTLMGWTCDLRDYEADRTSEDMLATVQATRGPRALGALARQLGRGAIPKRLIPGAVFLLHDAVNSPRATAEHTVAVIAPLVEIVRARSWRTELVSPESCPSAVIT